MISPRLAAVSFALAAALPAFAASYDGEAPFEGHGEEPPRPRRRPEQQRQPRLHARIYDRSDGEGFGARGQRGPRPAGAVRGRRAGATGLSYGIGARLGPQGLRLGLSLPRALPRRRPGIGAPYDLAAISRCLVCARGGAPGTYTGAS